MAVSRSPSLVAKVIPIEPLEPVLVVPTGDGFADYGRCPDGFPLPPPELREVDDYFESGTRHFRKMVDALASAGFDYSTGAGVLDFGCGSGRLARHFIGDGVRGPVWGVDINATSIAWCEAFLAPPEVRQLLDLPAPAVP